MNVTAQKRNARIDLSACQTPPKTEEIDIALKAIGRANRRKDVDANVRSLVRAHAGAVISRAADLNQPRENHAARNMIRFGLLPTNYGVTKLKALVKNNDELTRYVTALDDRMSQSVDALEAEEVLRLDSNAFTRRNLRKRGKLDALEKRCAEPEIQRIKQEKPSAEASSRYAAWRHADSPAKRNEEQETTVASQIGTVSVNPDLGADPANTASSTAHQLPVITPALSSQGPESPGTANQTAGEAQPPNGKAQERLSTAVSSFMPGHYPPGKEPAPAPTSAVELVEEGHTLSAVSSVRPLAFALDVNGCPADIDDSLVPHTTLDVVPPDTDPAHKDWEPPAPTTDADYKNKGCYYEHPGRRLVSFSSEEERFEQAIEAFLRLLEKRLGNGKARLFKHMPDLVHRLFSTRVHLSDETNRDDSIETLLEQMREGLRGGGSRLTSTAQKLLAWMAIVWNKNCLKLDDPAKVRMREHAGQFQVLESEIDGQETWRAARNGQIDVAYTVSVISSWFKGSKAVRLDKAALQNIGLNGPLYQSREGAVEFAPDAALKMGKQRLRALDAGNCLHLDVINNLRSKLHRRQMVKPIALALDLDRLSPAPLKLGNRTEFAWGETHGNTAMELCALHAMGMIRVSSQEGWKAIRAAITAADFNGLKGLLATHIERGNHADGRSFVLLGNTLAGPMGNDLIELQVRRFLRDILKIDMPELQSANNAYFDAYWKLNQGKALWDPFEMPIDRTPQQVTGQGGRLISLQQMNQLMNSNYPGIRRDARDLLKTCAESYYEGDRLQLCRMAEDGRTLLTGGRINEEISKALAKQIDADGYTVRTNLGAKAQVDDINIWFRQAVLPRNADAYLAATQSPANLRRDGTSAVDNPLAAYIGRYDASPFFPSTTLGHGIDYNVSGQSSHVDACWQLLSKFQPQLTNWLFQPFEAYVDTARPEICIASSDIADSGTRLFWRDEQPGLGTDSDVQMFDRLIANCLYEVAQDATPETWQRYATYILSRPAVWLAVRFGKFDSPERAALESLKNNVVASLTAIREPLYAWGRMHNVKNMSMTDKRFLVDALKQLKALPKTESEIEALARDDLIQLLFSGPVARLFRYARAVVKQTQSSQRDYAQTRFALNSHAGSEPQHQQFTRTFFGF